MDFSMKSPKLAGRLSHYSHNWKHITQDRWVLQAIAGYPLELIQTPHQMRHPQETQCSTEEHLKITQEVSDLLSKLGGSSGNPAVPEKFRFPDFPGSEKRGREEASKKPQSPQLLYMGRALQDGGPPSPSGFNSVPRLDGEARPEGCVPAGFNSPGPSVSPPVPVGTEDIPIRISTLWPYTGNASFHQDNEASSWRIEIQ